MEKIDITCVMSVEGVYLDEGGDMSVYGTVIPLVNGLEHLESPIEYTNTIH